eukprot:15457360-Alexandrium_andersonii.AAC.1
MIGVPLSTHHTHSRDQHVELGIEVPPTARKQRKVGGPGARSAPHDRIHNVRTEHGHVLDRGRGNFTGIQRLGQYLALDHDRTLEGRDGEPPNPRSIWDGILNPLTDGSPSHALRGTELSSEVPGGK